MIYNPFLVLGPRAVRKHLVTQLWLDKGSSSVVALLEGGNAIRADADSPEEALKLYERLLNDVKDIVE